MIRSRLLGFLLLLVIDGTKGNTCIPFNECGKEDGFIDTNNDMPETAPDDIDALDITSEDAYILVSQENAFAKFIDRSFALKFYVKFDTEQVTGKTVTFFEVPYAFHVARRPDGILMAQFDFRDMKKRTISRRIILQDEESDWIQLIGLRMKAVPEKRNQAAFEVNDEWTLIAITFEKGSEDRASSATFSINGKKVNVDSGDLDGLFQKAGPPKFMNAAVSSVEILESPSDANINVENVLQLCKTHFNENSCETSKASNTKEKYFAVGRKVF